MAQLRHDEPAKQLASLRACLSDETLRVVRNFPLQDAERSSIDVILRHPETYAVGLVNEVLQRMQFNNRVQSDHETFDDFLTALRFLSRLCNFCMKCNDSLIRDKMVIGLRSRETVQKRCAVSGLSLSRAISICRAEEATARDVSQIYGHGTDACRVRDSRRRDDGRHRDQPPSDCRECARRADGRRT